jgi:hypothetical protein
MEVGRVQMHDVADDALNVQISCYVALYRLVISIYGRTVVYIARIL